MVWCGLLDHLILIIIFGLHFSIIPSNYCKNIIFMVSTFIQQPFIDSNLISLKKAKRNWASISPEAFKNRFITPQLSKY